MTTAVADMMSDTMVRMRDEHGYTQRGIVELMRDLGPAYDLVRLVDPIASVSTALGKNDELFDITSRCYEYLGGTERCVNCVSRRALATDQVQSKIEASPLGNYYVIAMPVRVGSAQPPSPAAPLAPRQPLSGSVCAL